MAVQRRPGGSRTDSVSVRCGWCSSVGASVRSRGDSYDTAPAESIIGLFTTELDRNRGPWRGIDDLELDTFEWVDRFDNRRLFHALGRIPPAEFDDRSSVNPDNPRPPGTQTPGRYTTR